MGSNFTAFDQAALILAVIGCFSLPTLFAFWLSKSRLHWLFQSLVILAMACPLVVVRTYDLMLIILVAGFSVLAGSWLVQQRTQKKLQSNGSGSPQPRLQFGMKDFGAAFVLLGCFAAIWAQANQDNVWTNDLSGNLWDVTFCVLVGLAVAIWSSSLRVFRVLKFRYWLPWFAVLAGFAVPVSGLYSAESILSGAVVLSVHAVTVALIVWLFLGRQIRPEAGGVAIRPNANHNWLTIGKRLLGCTFVALFVLSISRYYLLLLPPPRYIPKRSIVAGQTNRFPELLKIGDWLSSTVLVVSPAKPGSKLAGDIKKHSKTFEKLEIALNSDNCFPVDWSSESFDVHTVVNAAGLRSIVRSLSTRSLQSLAEGRHDSVIEDGLLCFKLVDRISIDGILIHELYGVAFEGIAVAVTLPGIAGASDEQLRALANQLDEMMVLCGSIDVELERLLKAEEFYMRNSTEHWMMLLFYKLDRSSSIYDSTRDILIRRNTMRDLLRTEIAITLYRSENEKLPDNLDGLVPKFINSVPRDRYGLTEEQPFQYIVSKNRQSYRLYSFGLDNDDDGGEVDKDLWVREGDIDLQALYGDRLADNAKEVQEYEEEQTAQLREAQEYEAWEEEDLEESEDRLEEKPQQAPQEK